MAKARGGERRRPHDDRAHAVHAGARVVAVVLRRGGGRVRRVPVVRRVGCAGRGGRGDGGRHPDGRVVRARVRAERVPRSGEQEEHGGQQGRQSVAQRSVHVEQAKGRAYAVQDARSVRERESGIVRPPLRENSHIPKGGRRTGTGAGRLAAIQRCRVRRRRRRDSREEAENRSPASSSLDHPPPAAGYLVGRFSSSMPSWAVFIAPPVLPVRGGMVMVIWPTLLV